MSWTARLNAAFDPNIDQRVQSNFEEVENNDKKNVTGDCPVCLQSWSDTERPMTVKCGHTACSTCWYKTLDDRGVKCPICRKEHKTPVKWWDHTRQTEQLRGSFTKQEAFNQLMQSITGKVVVHVASNPKVYMDIAEANGMSVGLVTRKKITHASSFRKSKVNVLFINNANLEGIYLGQVDHHVVLHMPKDIAAIRRIAPGSTVKQMVYENTIEHFMTMSYGGNENSILLDGMRPVFSWFVNRNGKYAETTELIHEIKGVFPWIRMYDQKGCIVLQADNTPKYMFTMYNDRVKINNEKTYSLSEVRDLLVKFDATDNKVADLQSQLKRLRQDLVC